MKKLYLTCLVFWLLQTTAFSQAVDLNSFHDCRGTLIESDQVGYRGILSFLSPTRSECRDGSAVLAIQKYTATVDNQAKYEFTDTLRIQAKCPEECLYITKCKDQKNETRQYILLIDERVLTNEFFTDFKMAWTYDSNLKFIDNSSTELSCVNIDYGS
jgi:hypothetical protein